MTVKELIKELGKFPQDAEVAIYSESNYCPIEEYDVEIFLDRFENVILWCDIDPIHYQ